MGNTNYASKFFATGSIDDYLVYKDHFQNDEHDPKDDSSSFMSF